MTRASLKVSDDELTTYLVEDRRGRVSAYGKGNSKVGPGVFTYSMLPGRPELGGTCPGSTRECEFCCYAKRVALNQPVWDLWRRNTERRDEVPPVPAAAKAVRWHVSGDFATPGYILTWLYRVDENPGVQFFGYTRSWRVAKLLPYLERLQQRPNVQLFASVEDDPSSYPDAPEHWRWAWLGRPGMGPNEWREHGPKATLRLGKKVPIFACSEEVGKSKNCETCRYCVEARPGDVFFLRH